jgi:hypothetical protein
MAETKEKKEIKGKALIMEALTSSIAFYRMLEKAFLQKGNPQIAKRIGFLKIAIKELEKLKE